MITPQAVVPGPKLVHLHDRLYFLFLGARLSNGLPSPSSGG